MKFYLDRYFTCAAALLIASTAFGQTQVPNTFQAGQPARAAEVNANFTELEAAANQNAGDVATNAAAISGNASSVTDLQSDAVDYEMHINQLENDMDFVLDRVLTCGDYKVYGCTQSTSFNGIVFLHNWFAGGIHNIIYMRDESLADVADGLFFAIPTAIDPNTGEFDFQNLYIGGSSNITRTINGNLGPALVDDCDNPTVELVPTGEAASRRLVVNSGNFYRYLDTPIIDTVDVTGQTYGLINPQTPGNIVESCTLVTDQTGLYDRYAITQVFSVLDNRHDSPWTHQ